MSDRFQFNEEAVRKTYKNGNQFAHKSGSKIKLFPFTANDKKLNDAKEDLKSFHGVIGSITRIMSGTKLPNNFKPAKDLIEKAIEKTQTDSEESLEDILRQVIFQENGNLVIFSKQVYPYLKNNGDASVLNGIADLYTSLFINKDVEIESIIRGNNTQNALYDLVTSCLPELEKNKKKDTVGYHSSLSSLIQVFQNDLKFLMSDDRVFTENFDKLLKYYFFSYISNYSLQLNQFFDTKIQHRIYASFDTESLSQSRDPYLNGWKMLETKIENLFSHANALDLLHFIEDRDNILPNVFDYTELYAFLSNFSEEDQKSYQDEVYKLTVFYKSELDKLNFTWANFEEEVKKNKYPNDELKNSIWKVWHLIDLQFQKDKKGRNRAYSAYGNWFKAFCKENFNRNRGRLGQTISITQDYLLFLVLICIGNKPDHKIKLNDLWEEIEKRGIFLDHSTRDEMTEFLAKINLLETKSDSGDAQYVKQIL